MKDSMIALLITLGFVAACAWSVRPVASETVITDTQAGYNQAAYDAEVDSE
jgi:hypothetical protein